eukprot:m.14774 g.14774  ORF g.14774 m.14774 type:complete len:329 (+) comp8456_c0_seq2:101-1087(+)
MRGITVRLPTITDPGAPLPPPSDHDEALFVDITQHTDQVAPTQWDSTPLDQSPTPTTMADGPTTSGSNEFRLPRIIDRQEAARLKQADFAGRATELDDLAKRRGRMFPTKRTELQQTRSHGYLHVRENRRKSTGGLLTLASDLDALMTVRRQHKMPTTMMGENGTQSVLTTRVPATHSFPFRTKKVPSVQSAPPVLVVSPGTSPIARNGGHAEVSSRPSLPDVFWSASAKPVNEAHAGSNRQARTRHASYRSRSMSPARRLDNEYGIGNIGPDLLTLQSISTLPHLLSFFTASTTLASRSHDHARARSTQQVHTPRHTPSTRVVLSYF